MIDNKRRAFTLIELIFVIVVMGIVAMISSEIIVNIYDRYLISRTYNKLGIKTELALDTIARRLEYRIKPAVYAKEFNNTMIPLAAAATHQYPILEWLGYDNDSLDGFDTRAGWSGFVDVRNTASTTASVVTPASHLQSVALPILQSLSSDINASTERPAIVFFNSSMNDPSRYGFNGGDYNNTIPVSFSSDTVLSLGITPASIHEKYYLVWSAYAIVPRLHGGSGNCTDPTTQDCDLFFYYDFRPWEGDEYAAGSRALLLEHISQFSFKKVGNAIHLKLCAADPGFNNYLESNVSICKERVVF